MTLDPNHQDFSSHQNNLQPTPTTLASATTIAPTTLTTIITGTLAVATITPPLTGQHVLYLIFTDASPATTLTTGNISNAVIPTVNVPSTFLYNPITGKYWGWANNLT